MRKYLVVLRSGPKRQRFSFYVNLEPARSNPKRTWKLQEHIIGFIFGGGVIREDGEENGNYYRVLGLLAREYAA